MSEHDDQFDGVVETLAAHHRGRRRLPVLSDGDALTLASGLHRRADLLGAARARAAAAEGLEVACGVGCNACCRAAVMVYSPEALAVAEWLGDPANRAAREAFAAAYPAWRAALGELIDELVALHGAGELEAAAEVYARIEARDVTCAFNRDGACVIYPARPNACRYMMALETSDHCQPGAAEPVSMLEFSPYDEFVDRARALLRIAHEISGEAAPSALCDAVAALLSIAAGEPR